MGFCQWFRHFSDRINVLKLLKLTHCITGSIQATQFLITKMMFIRLLTIKDTSGMNLRINFPQLLDERLVNIEGKTSEIRLHTKKST